MSNGDEKPFQRTVRPLGHAVRVVSVSVTEVVMIMLTIVVMQVVLVIRIIMSTM